ncbi:MULTISPECIES: tetratricopeptide repeat protein [unclassified Chelatococcus]|uniref:tetratricopeptide repeat protein n=1 Tax=unclassified Chelatococcus TaxID=2638111 RepID=UPI001BCD44E6|nr:MULTISPECIES: tetratricopeptide repeat protein [unclassified Chelatococcus]CAH1666995.1 Tetratricopeptide repeat protein [Hyphomicrobiales bacterium]MBS7737970.1 tetratricopeptide repeat protein [Chelatococcus sp. HY11]MBX3546391.1 tetratricopeptide repeat protein [Chelatococcus sp.]MCO5077685.1 tetratricopeptide repeat protein [Chelatococcus sp.]CAH1680130.1 Tetratricopeptide repeat protein [Hyphomicrobiales bacterium]
MGIMDLFPAKAEGALCAGQRLLQEQSYREAEAAFVLAHTAEPRAEAPLLGLCRVSYATRNWRDLDRWTRRLLAVAPAHAEGQLLRARACNAERQWAPAAAAWAIVARERPDWPEAQFQLARALHRSGDPAGADAAGERLAAMAPRTALCTDLLGQLALERGRCEAAATFFANLVQEDPAAAWRRFEALRQARHYRGIAVMARALLEGEPGADASRAPAIQQAAEEALRNLAARAMAQERAGHLEEAFQDHTAILLADPGDGPASRGRARIKRTLLLAAHDALRTQNLHEEDWEAAREAFQRVVRLDDGDLDSRVQLGRLMMRQRDWTSAAQLWRSVIASSPRLVEAQLQLARALDRNDDHAAALSQWREVLELAPDNAEAREMLGQMPRRMLEHVRRLVDAGDLTKAVEALMLARSLSPDDPDLARRTDHVGRRLLQAMRAAFRSADWEAILAIQAATRSLRPDDADVHLLTGRAAMARRQYDLAIAAWSRLGELDPEMASMCRLQLARCHMRSGRLAEAQPIVAAILAEKPDHVEAHAMAAQLAARVPRIQAQESAGFGLGARPEPGSRKSRTLGTDQNLSL